MLRRANMISGEGASRGQRYAICPSRHTVEAADWSAAMPEVWASYVPG